MDPVTGEIIDRPLLETARVSRRGAESTHGTEIDAGSVIVSSRDSGATVEPDLEPAAANYAGDPDAGTRILNRVDLRTGRVTETALEEGPETEQYRAGELPQPASVPSDRLGPRRTPPPMLLRVAGRGIDRVREGVQNVRAGSAGAIDGAAGQITAYQAGKEAARQDLEARARHEELVRQTKAAQKPQGTSAALQMLAARVRGDFVDQSKAIPAPEQTPRDPRLAARLGRLSASKAATGGKAKPKDSLAGQIAKALGAGPPPKGKKGQPLGSSKSKRKPGETRGRPRKDDQVFRIFVDYSKMKDAAKPQKPTRKSAYHEDWGF